MKRSVVLVVLALALVIGVAAADTLVLPDDTVEIGKEAFYGVDADTIILPPGVTAIGDAAFGGSNKLRWVYVPESLMGRASAALAGSQNAVFVPLNYDWSAEYNYTVSDDAVTITKYKGTGTEVSIPAVIEGKPVTVIGSQAFKAKETLEKVIIPEGITAIEYDAFDGCSVLTDVTFPSTLSRISDNAFRNCGSAYAGTFWYRLPDDLTYIKGITDGSNYSFINCKAVMVVTPDSNTAKLLSTSSEDEKERRGCFTYPGELDFRYKFYQSEADGPYDTLHLMDYTGTGTEVSIPDHGTASTPVSVIHHKAFAGMETLTKVVIPESVTEIEYDAFDGCSALEKVIFPSTLKGIGSNAFRNCSKDVDTNVFFDLPDTMESISNVAFVNCKAKLCCNRYISSDYSDETTTYQLLGERWWGWADGPFRLTNYRVAYTVYHEDENGITELTAYENRLLLGGYVTEPGTAAPQTLTIPEMVYAIGDDCFRGMTSLKHVVIPDYQWQEGDTCVRYVSRIGDRAFMDCLNLTDIAFPPTLSLIGENAFSGCGNNSTLPYTFAFSYPEGTLYGLERHAQDLSNIVYTFPGCNAELSINWIEVHPILN